MPQLQSAEIDSLMQDMDFAIETMAGPVFDSENLKVDSRFSIDCPTAARINLNYKSRRKGIFVVDSLHSTGSLQKDAEQIQTAIERYCVSNNLKPAAELIFKEKV